MRQVRSFTAIFAAALLWLGAAFGVAAAQAPQPNKNMVPTFVSYTQLGRALDINATTASFSEALGTAGPVMAVFNTGSNWAYVNATIGAGTVTVANGVPVGPGSCSFINSQGADHIQAITATSTTTLQVGIGWGNPGSCGGGGGGGGGSSGAVFGPTAVGSAVANPPVVVGGSQNGLAGGLVGVLKVDATGLAYVNCANCSGSGASAVDSAAFAPGTSVMAPSGFAFNDGLSALSSGTQGTGRITSFRAQHVNLRNNSGTEIGTASTPIQVSLANTAANGAAILVTGTGGTFPITAASLPLPSGAATSANQPTNTAAASTTSGQTGSMNLAAVTTASPTYANGTSNFLTLTTAGALRVDGSAVTQPVSGTVAFSNASLAVTQATASSLNATVVGTGTFAVQLSGATNNINNISGTISLPTGAAISANQPTNAAIASTTAGQTGNLHMGAVTTGSPTYTTGQTDPLSLTTAGALRVDGSAVTQPVSGTVAFSNTSIQVTQATAASLNATVVGTGTFAVQATQAGTWNIGTITTLPALVVGSAIIGKVGIDQTTPGTTNAVTKVPSGGAAAEAISPVNSSTPENSHVFKASAGNVFSIAATNLTNTPAYLVLLNVTTAPADGAITPLACAPMPASGSASINYGAFPARYTTGIVAVVTSAVTCFTKTTGVVTAFLSGQVQ